MRISFFAAVLFGFLASGCGGSSSTAPATTATTPTPADPTVTQNFSDTVPVGGAKFFSFNVAVFGTVNVTLVSVGGTNVPPTVFMGVGIGQPSGTTCTTTTSANVQAGTAIAVTASEDVGLYCVNIADVGNLIAPATFTITIAHP